MEIILSQTLLVYTDGIRPSAILSVYINKISLSVYTDGIVDDLYSLFGKLQWCGDVDYFKTSLPTE
jgi:hypothetical protein